MIEMIGLVGMIGWIRNMVLVFFVLSIVYVALTFISRLRQRDRLKAEFNKEAPEVTKDEFMETGMARYNRSLRAKLVLSVYLIPLAAFGLLMFLALNE